MDQTASDTEPMASLEIRKGIDDEIEAGGLRFVACRREVDVVDGGITLYVRLAEPSDDRELLRFDLFRNRPHYHAPASNPQETKIEASGAAESVAWGVEHLTREMDRFVRQAGFDDVAGRLDLGKIAAAGPALRRLLAELAEPTEVSHFPIPKAQLEALLG
ncbi:hypothetical protein K2X89_13925 [Myxococcota bacterium]|nr:hypothetical protein [Myxococcota bacterium]